MVEVAPAQESPPRGPWHVTRTAAAQYSRMFGGGESQEELDEARRDLLEAAKTAHETSKRTDRPDLAVWRASPEWHRLRFYVGKPLAGTRKGLPTLVRVLPPWDGWQPGGEEKGEAEMLERDEPESERSRDAIAAVIEKVVEGLGLAEKQRALAVALWRTVGKHPALDACVDVRVNRVVVEDGGEKVSLSIDTFPRRGQGSG